ncbi:MAG TPA: hypothetical protein DEQ43_16810 [Nocardioides bacterium]|nr:hypothetical protein [Nocardioides sp.]
MRCESTDHRQVWSGTSRLEVIGDTPTLTKLYDQINATAHQLLDPARPAEEQPSLAHRKVAALGVIATGAGATSKTKLYLHLTKGEKDAEEIGAAEKLGPLTLARIREWLGAGPFAVQPVLDLARTDAVDGYRPPTWMRELVILRDVTCEHPNCTGSESRWATADHRARPGPTTSPHCAGDITGPRPTTAGPPSATPTAATPGPTPTTGATTCRGREK